MDGRTWPISPYQRLLARWTARTAKLFPSGRRSDWLLKVRIRQRSVSQRLAGLTAANHWGDWIWMGTGTASVSSCCDFRSALARSVRNTAVDQTDAGASRGPPGAGEYPSARPHRGVRRLRRSRVSATVGRMPKPSGGRAIADPDPPSRSTRRRWQFWQNGTPVCPTCSA
jgi:hypothetical protein